MAPSNGSESIAQAASIRCLSPDPVECVSPFRKALADREPIGLVTLLLHFVPNDTVNASRSHWQPWMRILLVLLQTSSRQRRNQLPSLHMRMHAHGISSDN